MRGGFDRDRAARVLVDAVLLGDKKAAERWQITERTIGNYRSRLKTDGELSELYDRIGREAERNWHLVRNRFLRDVTEHLRELCLKAGPEQIKDVREAIKDIGELDLAREALGVGTGDRHESTSLAADAGRSDASEDEGSPRSGTIC